MGAGLGAPPAADPPLKRLLPLQVPPDQRDPGLPQLPPLFGEARLRLTARGARPAPPGLLGPWGPPRLPGPFRLRLAAPGGRGAGAGGGGVLGLPSAWPAGLGPAPLPPPSRLCTGTDCNKRYGCRRARLPAPRLPSPPGPGRGRQRSVPPPPGSAPAPHQDGGRAITQQIWPVARDLRGGSPLAAAAGRFGRSVGPLSGRRGRRGRGRGGATRKERGRGAPEPPVPPPPALLPGRGAGNLPPGSRRAVRSLAGWVKDGVGVG